MEKGSTHNRRQHSSKVRPEKIQCLWCEAAAPSNVDNSLSFRLSRPLHTRIRFTKFQATHTSSSQCLLQYKDKKHILSLRCVRMELIPKMISADIMQTTKIAVHQNRMIKEIAIIVLILSICGCTENVSSDSAGSSRSIENICQQAKNMLQRGEPQLAIDLIDATRKDITEQVNIDKGNGVTSASNYCQEEYLDAHYLLAEKQAQSIPLFNFPPHVLDFKELWAVPPIGIGLSIITGVLGSYLIAALLSKIRFLENTKHHSQYFKWIGIAGGIALATGTIFLFTALSYAAIGQRKYPENSFIFTILSIVFGILLVAYSLANRMRLYVTVRNADSSIDKVKTNTLIVLMRNLGYQKTYNDLTVKMDNGANVLANATVQGTPENRVMAVLLFIFNEILGLSPWHVLVDETTDGCITIIVDRNGRSRANALISPKLLKPYMKDSQTTENSNVDSRLYKFAAAVVISSLAKSYRDFPDLCGASDWRSIGLHYVAKSVDDDEPRADLLKEAVEYDPGNLPALLMLMIAENRRSTSGDEINAYANWLIDHSRKAVLDEEIKAGHDQFYRMCLIHYLNAVRNLRNCKDFHDSHPEAHLQADILMKLVEKMKPQDSYYQIMFALTKIARIGIIKNPPRRELYDLDKCIRSSQIRVIRYNLACVLLEFGAKMKEDDLISRALEHLRFAITDKELKSWAPQDPVLTQIALPLQSKASLDLIINFQEKPSGRHQANAI